MTARSLDKKKQPAHLATACAMFFASAMALGGCGVPGPDGNPDTYNLDFSLPQGAKTDGVIIFAIDGLHASTFQQMLEAGELPAIKKYFVDRGLYAPRAAASVPAITLPNFTSIVTGRLPGHTGLVANTWFDRDKLVYRDLTTIAQKDLLDDGYLCPNIYEQFPDRTTVSIFFQPHRGTTKFVEDWTSGGPPFFFGWFEMVDRLTLSRLDLVMDIARTRREFPAVIVPYLLAPDFEAYEHGASSPQYRQALIHTDRQIGRVLGDIKRAGLLDKIHIALVSDHGHSDVSRHLPLDKVLGAGWLDTAENRLWERMPFGKRLDYYDRHSAVIYGGGDKFMAVCLRKPVLDANGALVRFEPWNIRPNETDLRHYPCHNLDALLRDTAHAPLPGMKTGERFFDMPRLLLNTGDGNNDAPVDAVAYAPGDNRVRLMRSGGVVEFSQPGGPGSDIVCKLLDGEDPLGWKGKVPPELLAGKPASPRAWLEATAETDFPALPDALLAYFRSRRAGDLVAFAAPGWDFNETHRSGHGGIRADDMYVPMLLAGPGVPHGRLNVVRTIDLMPTLLGLLGRPIPPALDGVNLLPVK